MSDICIVSAVLIGAILACVHFALTVGKIEDEEMGCDDESENEIERHHK